MRWPFLMLLGAFAGLASLGTAFAQQTTVAKEQAMKKGGTPPPAVVGSGTAQDYQKDNPMLKTDLTKVSPYQGKMFETKEFKPKEFGTQSKDQPIVLNKMFTKDSSVVMDKNGWQSKEANSLKKSDMTDKQSTIGQKRALSDKGDVTLKMAKGYDGKAEDAKKAEEFNKMLADGQKRYLGPESPQVATEMEMIRERLKNADTPEDLKKNELTTDEVQKLLMPRQPMTRAK